MPRTLTGVPFLTAGWNRVFKVSRATSPPTIHSATAARRKPVSSSKIGTHSKMILNGRGMVGRREPFHL
jgi:hypothetical protein